MRLHWLFSNYPVEDRAKGHTDLNFGSVLYRKVGEQSMFHVHRTDRKFYFIFALWAFSKCFLLKQIAPTDNRHLNFDDAYNRH